MTEKLKIYPRKFFKHTALYLLQYHLTETVFIKAIKIPTTRVNFTRLWAFEWFSQVLQRVVDS